MNRTLSTILLLFYLISSMGHASVQHYCTMMQSGVDMAEQSCCCAADATETAESCETPKDLETASDCCSSQNDSDNSSSSAEPEAIFVVDHSDCCETHSEYNQLADSTLSKTADAGSDQLLLNKATTINTEEYHLQIPKIHISTDPSLHFNLPLII